MSKKAKTTQAAPENLEESGAAVPTESEALSSEEAVTGQASAEIHADAEPASDAALAADAGGAYAKDPHAPPVATLASSDVNIGELVSLYLSGAHFRKKPVIISAVRYEWEDKVEGMSQEEVQDRIADFMGTNLAVDADGGIEIETLEGTMTASRGDWIIRGVKGEFYPCKPDVFELSYDLAVPIDENDLATDSAPESEAARAMEWMLDWWITMKKNPENFTVAGFTTEFDRKIQLVTEEIVELQGREKATEVSCEKQQSEEHPQGSFSWALEELKKGNAVCRAGWNGKGMFVYLVNGGRWPSRSKAGQNIADKEPDNLVPYRSYLAMKTAQGDVVPWVASQSDLLVGDWAVAEDKREE